MVKRKERRDASCDSSLSAASTPTLPRDVTRSSTPSSPVQIPKNGIHFHRQHLLRRNNSHGGFSRRMPPVHSPESLSPSMAALLAITDIPRPRQSRRKARRADHSFAVQEHAASNDNDNDHGKDLCEKELGLALGRASPLDVLLSPPDSLEDDDDGFGHSPSFGCPMTRTLSADSVPSLGDSSGGTDCLSSSGSPRSQSPTAPRRRMMSPMRKPLEPIRSPPDTIDEHPLAPSIHDLDELDFVTVEKPDAEDGTTSSSSSSSPFKPFKMAFRSNLTASLRVLRFAARSLSNINFPSIPPDDFVTRTFLTVDPAVPFTDERRPPVSRETPSAEVRRYLNPTSRLSLEVKPGTFLQKPKFSASIQMQTYRIQRSRLSPSSRGPISPFSSSPSSQNQPSTDQSSDDPASTLLVPGMRQREMRENPDFIRIAVMEMAMRRRGKLDNNKPGRARWALPPRKTSLKPYEIGADGVPERWNPLTYED